MSRSGLGWVDPNEDSVSRRRQLFAPAPGSRMLPQRRVAMTFARSDQGAAVMFRSGPKKAPVTTEGSPHEVRHAGFPAGLRSLACKSHR
jgi:hypothetical protein